MSRRSLPLNAIHAFIVTARHLNLTHAAAELCITQGAVSRKIAALESWLGFPLFDRHARGLTLTPQGAALLPALKSGFDQMVHATEKASKSNRSVRLKAPTCAMRWLLPKLVELEQLRPDIHISLTTTVEHSSQLDNFDAAIVYGAPLEKGYRLFDEALTPVMSASLLKQQQLMPEDLAHFTFLHPTADSTDWQLWLRAQQVELVMKRNQHFATMDLAISAAIQGYGITVADVTLIQADLAMQRLVAPFSNSVKTGAVYSLLQRPENDAPPFLTELVAWLCLERDPLISSAG
ncbi:LysR substrate-binding domain-containing protein [Erwiniaceae bacterium BAC15a-03b]|uniref:LysR substrate-binding domain-containing protein n=1 Tax=Winslowiella arboricola TaxID=2978220 RepID=A0A9J6PQ53_9GAMM|nr:LysR substrate-binding domain-containing protein [Winslowiella arboricola]MCU5775588.1 LysR substrate-binding domain-containing protein [Winslowiella arboricola]MCU5779562.1 LysR substrate-binding domain-containing protein [Winslowiella arboricola]